MRAIALLGGPKEEWPHNLATEIKEASKKGALIMASDRGSLFLLELGIVPDVALGDYDSLTFDEREIVESKVKDMRYSNPIKDFTVNCSWRNTNARINVKTTLSLSIGTTFEASPTCNAL